jgi:hypothetical protein
MRLRVLEQRSMSQPNNSKAASGDMTSVVEMATRMSNVYLVCLREVHHYLIPKAQAEGIAIDAQNAHALAVSLWIQLSREKAWLRMPATRFTKAEPKEQQAQKKPELFPRSEAPLKPESQNRETPFANPAISPALRKLREMLKRDSVNEREVVQVLREATPRGTTAPTSLDEAPERTLSLLLSRWEVTRELIEAARADGGGEVA